MEREQKLVRVLVMVDWYDPGFKAGGPIRSAVNFTNQLESVFDIYVLTTDRDLGDNLPYPGIVTDQWTKNGFHQICYLAPGSLRWEKLRKLINEVDADFIYLNSMFSLYFSIYPLLMKRLGNLKSKIVLAPRGMLKGSALQHKTGKKKLFIKLLKILGIPGLVTFQATDDNEEKDIRNQFGDKVEIYKTGNLSGKQPDFIPPGNKKKGELKLIFVGRIHPIKNLDFLLCALQSMKQKIDLTIVATLEDEVYWEKCKGIIKDIPDNITINLLLDISHEKIMPIISEHHIFALPTKGENFGHSIFEAMSVGRPVLISDQTPWRNLEFANAGWDFALSRPEAFRVTLRLVSEMDYDQLMIWCKGAWDYCNAYVKQSEIRNNYIKLFN